MSIVTKFILGGQVLVFAALWCAPQARGEPLVYEGFAYSAGSLSGKNGGIGWLAGWLAQSGAFNTSADTLVDSNFALVPSGHQAVCSPGSNPRASRTLLHPFGASGTTTYLSFLLRQNSLGNGGFHDYGGIVLGGKSGGGGGLYVGRGALGRDTWKVVVGVAGNANSELESPDEHDIGEIIWVLVKIQFTDGEDLIQMHASSTPPPAEPEYDVEMSTIDLGNITQLHLASGNGSAWSIDELTMGSNYLDAVRLFRLQPRGALDVSWPTQEDRRYQLERLLDIGESNWTQFGDVVIGSGGFVASALSLDRHSHAFYRVRTVE